MSAAATSRAAVSFPAGSDALVALPRCAGAAPDIETLASDNAVEGWVREAWGALFAMLWACMPLRAHVRSTMSRIAHDEVPQPARGHP